MDEQAASSAGDCAGRRDDPSADWARLHGAAVFDLLARLCGNRHDAEDLHQETFLRALRHRDSFIAGSNARAWLMRIASNAFLDLCRRRKTARALPLEMDIAQAHDPGASLEQRELADAVMRAVADLPEPARVVFLLRTREELPFAEIAQAIGATEETARWHMMKARRELLERLGGLIK